MAPAAGRRAASPPCWRIDTDRAHIQDTLTAGAGLCDPVTTRFVVEHGKAAIDWLIAQGVPFTRDAENGVGFHLTREGGHSHRRIIHAADATGQAVQETLAASVKAHPNITVLEHHIAIDLITGKKLGRGDNRCYGAYVLDVCNDEVLTFAAQDTILATGGAGKVYLYTTNPDTATGDGIAMGWRAGCRVANMEFIQFHPTCLYHPHAKSFLITEAVRGEGGILKLPDGTRFMPWHDERAELAPRDIVARAIDFEMKKRGLDCVYLDISHKPEAFLKEHFPNIYARCLALGIDIARQPIPVVPAAHYTCGGVVADLHGRTDVDNLYAIGETAYTGLHGANRLASNSLLECLVFAEAAAQDILARPQGTPIAAAAVGRKPGDRCRRTDRHLAQLGRTAPLHVGLRRHRAHHQAPAARAAPHPAAARGNQRILRQFPRHRRPAGTAQPGAVRRPDRAKRTVAPRKPRPALQQGLSRHIAARRAHRARAAGLWTCMIPVSFKPKTLAPQRHRGTEKNE